MSCYGENCIPAGVQGLNELNNCLSTPLRIICFVIAVCIVIIILLVYRRNYKNDDNKRYIKKRVMAHGVNKK